MALTSICSRVSDPIASRNQHRTSMLSLATTAVITAAAAITIITAATITTTSIIIIVVVTLTILNTIHADLDILLAHLRPVLRKLVFLGTRYIRKRPRRVDIVSRATVLRRSSFVVQGRAIATPAAVVDVVVSVSPSTVTVLRTVIVVECTRVRVSVTVSVFEARVSAITTVGVVGGR
jgi:hypothetical protein